MKQTRYENSIDTYENQSNRKRSVDIKMKQQWSYILSDYSSKLKLFN